MNTAPVHTALVSEDDVLAAELADAAGQRLMALRESRADDETASLRAAGDRQSHEFLMAELAARRPGDAVLSEEGRDDLARLSARRVWIVDPLDGTREFGELDRSDWAVHVALWEEGQLTAGAVALPAQGKTLSTAAPAAARPAAAAAQGSAPGATPRLQILVSRSRPPAVAVALAERLGADLVPLGSAGAKAAVVITGGADAYVHTGGQYEWDSAAPVAVAQAAGLHCSRIDGSALRYNQEDTLLPDILMCRADLAATLLEAIAAVSREG